jgi:MraZ protein
MAFRGYYDNTLDAKNRLTIPAKLRNQLADGVVVALQRDARRCIAIWCASEFDEHVERTLAEVAPLSGDYGRLERFLNAYSNEVELDAAGRVMLPSKLIEQSGLGREVAVIGAGNRLEVWDRDAWLELSSELPESVQEIGPGTSDGHTA